MASSSTLQYLLDIVQTDELSSMSRLAALTIINKLFISDNDGQIMQKCIKADITSSLLTALDLGLSTSCDSADTVYVSVAMEVMSRLSKLSESKNQCLQSKGVVQRLLSYLDVTGPFYRFSHSTKTALKELCENKQLVGKVKVVAMAMEPLDYIHLHTNNKLKGHVRLPDSVKLCDMYDTEGSEDVSISSYFTKSGIAWQGSFPGDVVKDHDDNWQEILVTEVLDGGMFWGQVGEKCIKEVSQIQVQLNSEPELQRRGSMKTGDVVMVRRDLAGTSCLLRAQVMSSDGRSVDVFAVDFGYTLTVPVSEVYCLPEQLGVAIIPRKISLCAVAGLQPKPFDEDLVRMAASALTSLSKLSMLTGEIICNMGGLTILEQLLQKALSPALTTQLVSLVSNLACNRRIRKDMNGSNLVASLLGVMSRYVEQIKASGKKSQKADCDVRMALIRSIMGLANMMHGNPPARELFYSQQGINVTVQLLKILGGKSDTMYRMVLRLFRQFIGKAVIKTTGVDTQAQLPSPAAPQQSADLLHRVNESQPWGRGPDRSGRSLENDSWDSDSEADSDHDAESKAERKRQREPVSVESPARYYRGSSVKVWDDDCHEICPSRQVAAVSARRLAEHVCGMLNTGHGGVLYLGLNKDGEVFGLELSRDEKDRFRLGIDQIMCRNINPTLLHSQMDIEVRPVYDPDTDTPIQDLYVMEIIVQPSRASIYTLVDQVCYYRFGSETSSVSRRELRQLIAIEEESVYIDQIKTLLQQRDHLMSTLQLTSYHSSTDQDSPGVG